MFLSYFVIILQDKLLKSQTRKQSKSVFKDGDFASAWGIGAVLLVLVLAINLAARLAKTKLKQKQ